MKSWLNTIRSNFIDFLIINTGSVWIRLENFVWRWSQIWMCGYGLVFPFLYVLFFRWRISHKTLWVSFQFQLLFAVFFFKFYFKLSSCFNTKFFYRLKRIFMCNILIDSASLFMMGVFRDKLLVLLLSASCGIFYATLFTVPYILVAHYHSTNVVSKMMINL